MLQNINLFLFARACLNVKTQYQIYLRVVHWWFLEHKTILLKHLGAYCSVEISKCYLLIFQTKMGQGQSSKLYLVFCIQIIILKLTRLKIFSHANLDALCLVQTKATPVVHCLVQAVQAEGFVGHHVVLSHAGILFCLSCLDLSQ